MRFVPTAATLVAAALLIGAPAFAQTTPDTTKPSVSLAQNKSTQDGNPGGAGYKQKVDGNDPTTVGPGSQAYKQKTQSLSHGAAEKQN